MMKEARELITYFDERGWDWTSALAFTLCRSMFGPGFVISARDDGYYLVRHKYKKQVQP